MYPLLEIKSIPIEIQIKTSSAKLEYSRGTAEMEISRSEGGGVDVKSRPIKVNLDTFEPHAPGGVYRAPAPAAEAPGQPAYQATSAYLEPGELMVSAQLGQNVMGQFTPMAGGEGESQYAEAQAQEMAEGSVSIRYEMDKLNFDWKIDKGEFKFTPGDIEVSVSQRPDVLIKYMGGPIYVPRSADPNYEPVDVRA